MKKIIDLISDFFRRIFEKDFSLKIFSILCAAVIWFLVSISVYPTIDQVVYNVPVTIEMQGTYAEAHNYKVIEQSVETVDVYLQGDRSQIGNISAEDIKVSASAENVISAREYSLPLDVISTNGRSFTVKKITPVDDARSNIEYIYASFDEVVTKEITLSPMLDRIHVASGYIVDDDDVAVAPNTVQITGPKDDVEKIDSAYFYVDSTNVLSSSYEYTADEPTIYSSDGIVLTGNDSITFSRTNFSVSIPVYKKQVLPLEVAITNAPTSFDVDAFRQQLEFSVSELEIAAPAEEIKDVPAITIGTIDMREVDIGSVFTFNASDFLAENYQNLSGIDTISVVCPSEGLYKIAMTIRGSAVQIINAPAQFDYNIITSGFTLFFIGSEESINQISYIDVVSQIDLLNYELEARDYKLPVTFSTPAFDDVWCISSDGLLSPKATVTFTLKS
ncbi:MAG: YbbR-like domain-containing protein [Oscillospiraceae bacterium]